ncbi:MAG TPA: hypothetical protein VN958_00450 [Chitinophagaceae bacterium]|nr:hypothetical protein [Chitinophagaceae bacterium]
MLVIIVSLVFIVLAVYMMAGIVFTVLFQIKGLSKIDEGVHGSTIGFRIIIIPGCIVFWPVLLKKWIKVSRTSVDGEV